MLTTDHGYRTGAGWMSGEGTLARRSAMLEALSLGGVISAALYRLMSGAHASGVLSIVHARGVRTDAGVAQTEGGASLRN